MEYALLVGLAFWSLLAFFGTRKAFASNHGPLCAPLRALKGRAPKVLFVAAGVGLALGVYFTLQEIAAVQRQAGLLGPSFMMGCVCGIAGAIALSAQLYLEPEAQ